MHLTPPALPFRGILSSPRGRTAALGGRGTLKTKIRALIHSADYHLHNSLSGLLMQAGFRGTTKYQGLTSISSALDANCLPVLFLDLTEDQGDLFCRISNFQQIQGFELIPIVPLVPENRRAWIHYGVQTGAHAVLQKPMHQNAVSSIFSSLNALCEGGSSLLTIRATKELLARNWSLALPLLRELALIPGACLGAEISLSRCEIHLGQVNKAAERLQSLAQQTPESLWIQGERLDAALALCHIPEALELCSAIQNIHPEMTYRIWDHVQLLIETDQCMEALRLLRRIVKLPPSRDDGLECLSRMMWFLGFRDYIPGILKHSAPIAKAYSVHLALVS